MYYFGSEIYCSQQLQQQENGCFQDFTQANNQCSNDFNPQIADVRSQWTTCLSDCERNNPGARKRPDPVIAMGIAKQTLFLSDDHLFLSLPTACNLLILGNR
jgi:hypothetical protein